MFKNVELRLDVLQEELGLPVVFTRGLPPPETSLPVPPNRCTRPQTACLFAARRVEWDGVSHERRSSFLRSVAPSPINTRSATNPQPSTLNSKP